MKVLIVSSNEISTRDLVNKMKEIFSDKRLDIEVKGVAYKDIISEIDGASVVLLGPHVKHSIRKVIKIAELKEIPVGVIDHITYGMGNAKKVIDTAINLMNK